MSHKPETLVDLLLLHAGERPDERAYLYLDERGAETASLTFAELATRATALAGRMSEQVSPGDRAALLFPPGLDFIVALFACMVAKVIAVPMMPPRRRGMADSGAHIIADCAPSLALTTRAFLGGGRPDILERFSGLKWLAVDEDVSDADLVSCEWRRPSASDIAFLQYTSGSISAPKGVVVRHGDLIANLDMIRIVCGNTSASTYVNWVPLYHDMGLILNALQAFYVGALCVLMSPVNFTQRPLSWLRAVSHYGAEVAGGPNFGFDLCVSRLRPEEMDGIDLSRWKLAFVGAEPVRATTIENFTEAFRPYGFAPNTFWPGYGMAEATLLISGSPRGSGPLIKNVSRAALQKHRIALPEDAADTQHLVGCGHALVGERIAIVDPESRRELGPDQVGEIWASGPNIGGGYWQKPEATAEIFAAQIVGEQETRWLRTGDLGFLDPDGELTITGRLKDVVIIRGANHYPQDIEDTVERCDPALRRHGAAAFGFLDDSGEERLVIVQEVERSQRHRLDAAAITTRIREAVTREHDIAPFAIALIQPGTLPKTTSGKVQRGLTRQLWQNGGLDLL